MNAVLGKFAKAVPPPVLNKFTKVVLQVLPPLLIKLLNSSNPFIAPPGVANLSGVMGSTSLNVGATPMVSSNVQPQFSFDRQTPSNGQLAEKIFNLPNQIGRAIAADCGASGTQNAQQSTPKIAGSEPNKFSELTATQLAKLMSENIQTFPTDVWIKEDISGAVVLSVVAASEFPIFRRQIILF